MTHQPDELERKYAPGRWLEWGRQSQTEGGEPRFDFCHPYSFDEVGPYLENLRTASGDTARTSTIMATLAELARCASKT